MKESKASTSLLASNSIRQLFRKKGVLFSSSVLFEVGHIIRWTEGLLMKIDAVE